MKNTIKKRIGKQKTFILTLVLCAAIGSITTGCAKAEVTEKSITAELGAELSQDPKDYVTANKDSMYEEMKVDLSGVDTTKTGDYTILITYKEKKYEVALTIEDMTAPSITPVSYYALKPDMELSAEEVLGEITDASGKWNTYVISCEKEAELNDIDTSDEVLESLEPEVSEEENYNITKDCKDTISVSEEGDYLLTVAAVDESGNASIAELHLYVDGTAPDIIIEDDEISVDVSGYETDATDIVDVMDELHALAGDSFKCSVGDNFSINTDNLEATFETLNVNFDGNDIIEQIKIEYSITDVVGNTQTLDKEMTVTYSGASGQQIAVQVGMIAPPASNSSGNASGDAGGNAGENNGGNSSGSSNVTITPGLHPEIAQEIYNLVNAERANAGLPALAWNGTLASCADIRAQEIVSRFEHVRPDGSNPLDMVMATGATGSGENIAYGHEGASGVMNAWMNSEGHRANILRDWFTDIGVGVYEDGNGRLHYVQLFARY